MSDREQSIKDQIAAMEGWAIKTKQNVDSGKYKEAEELLRTINTQGRRLEWRGRLGLRHLPHFKEVKNLKQKITEARAAAQQSMTFIKYLEKLDRREGKKPQEIAAIKKDEIRYKQETGKNVSIMIQMLKEASVISTAEPWNDPKQLILPEYIGYLFQCLKGRGHYKDPTERAKIMRSIDLTGKDFRNENFKRVNFEGAKLVRADFMGAKLQGANFNGADLTQAILYGAELEGAHLEMANLTRAICGGADFTEANLTGADFWAATLERADFTRANLHGAKLGGTHLQGAILTGADIKEASFTVAHNLTLAQLHSAKNWELAKHVPSYVR